MRGYITRSLAAGIAVTIMALTCVAASAQPGPGNFGWGPGMMMGPGMMGINGFGFMCNPRAAGLAEWRMERIEWAVRPTDAQRAALNDLRAASTKAAETIAAACPNQIPEKSTERLALMEKRLDAMQQAIKMVRPAFEALLRVARRRPEGSP